ncbi:catalase family peroxidase [Actinoplanes sp. TBRC 11911]|uniref:catalase family peroxidase n=1 Tax=Actinoplanes sp. TBRC 11911 TaxID=2729386 RepID=UPI00145CEA0D|nr:catalase family peroxidase [Actinoplanes sp. TBRC 11911]NMO53001.1 catalase family peroxidase [Actinoplanes sp. TBRC 11911]
MGFDDAAAVARTVDNLERNDGKHPGFRRAQARGTVLTGVFTPSGAAAELTTAAHLQQDEVPVTVRFSNSSGNPDVPDTARVVRGMTVRFALPGGAYTDLIGVSIPVFLAPTPQAFMEAVDAIEPDPATGAPDVAKVGAYIVKYPRTAAAFATANEQPPASYATIRYWALHAFVWRGPAGRTQAVRYRWEPDAGVAGQQDLDGLPFDYLTREIETRASAGFSLHVQLAEPGDPTDDATQAWPDDRPEIVAGHLQLTGPVADQAGWDAKGFDPTNLTDGIELSDDPLLAFRHATYAESVRRRSAERGLTRP